MVVMDPSYLMNASCSSRLHIHAQFAATLNRWMAKRGREMLKVRL